MMQQLRRLRTRLQHLTVFTAGVIQYGTPPWLWTRAWREIEADHLARVRRMIWEAKKAGRIFEALDGSLWPTAGMRDEANKQIKLDKKIFRQSNRRLKK